MDTRLALVTGATGYVGGQVAAELVARGWRVRVLSRRAEAVRALPWGDRVEIIEGDASEAADVARALDDADVAWYLLHSMSASDDFVAMEKEMASTFAQAASASNVSRIVYLGGLHPDDEPLTRLSDHLRSRVEVGQVLIGSGVPTAALQAGVVIGDRSSSFIMLRHLSERLPGAVAPEWIKNRIQPISVADVVHYLVGAADLPPEVNRTFDIGGPEAMPYGEMMSRCAAATGRWFPRSVGTAPVTTPGLAGHWIGLVTPVSSTLAAPLIGSLQHDTVVHERDIDDLIGAPPGGHTSFDEAVRQAVEGLNTHRWLRTLAGTSAAVALTALIGSRQGRQALRTGRLCGLIPLARALASTDLALVTALTMADLAEDERFSARRVYALVLGTHLMVSATPALPTATSVRRSTVRAALLTASSVELVRRAAAMSPEKAVGLLPYAAWTGITSMASVVRTHAMARRS